MGALVTRSNLELIDAMLRPVAETEEREKVKATLNNDRGLDLDLQGQSRHQRAVFVLELGLEMEVASMVCARPPFG